MPERRLFVGIASGAAEAYYATLFHELVRWSGKPSRLNRDLSGRLGGLAYAMEELAAELGSAIVGADFGITARLCSLHQELALHAE